VLRDRTGDYTADQLTESGGVDGAPLLLSDQPFARCNDDACLAERVAGGRRWRILATRSKLPIKAAELAEACAAADIVVSDRRLPRSCRPRWLKLDHATLARTGGIAIALPSGRIATVNRPGDRHPWRAPPTIRLSRSGEAGPTASPEPAPAPDGSAADRRSGWRDRAAPWRLHDGNT
jgi:competence protein ComEC